MSNWVRAECVLFQDEDANDIDLTVVIANMNERMREMQKMIDEHQRDLYEVRGRLNSEENLQKRLRENTEKEVR